MLRTGPRVLKLVEEGQLAQGQVEKIKYRLYP